MNPGKSCWKSVYAFFVPGEKYFLKCKIYYNNTGYDSRDNHELSLVVVCTTKM